MSKIINIREPETIVLQFKDRKINLIYNIRALVKLQEIKGDLDFEGLDTQEVCTLIVCAGSRQLTLEEANVIVESLDLGTLSTLIRRFEESFGITAQEIKKKKNQLEMKRFTQKRI